MFRDAIQGHWGENCVHKYINIFTTLPDLDLLDLSLFSVLTFDTNQLMGFSDLSLHSLHYAIYSMTRNSPLLRVAYF